MWFYLPVTLINAITKCTLNRYECLSVHQALHFYGLSNTRKVSKVPCIKTLYRTQRLCDLHSRSLHIRSLSAVVQILSVVCLTRLLELREDVGVLGKQFWLTSAAVFVLTLVTTSMAKRNLPRRIPIQFS